MSLSNANCQLVSVLYQWWLSNSCVFCMFQYFSPYLSADMNKMAAAFNTSVPALEDELMQLILDGQINARIDSHNKVSAYHYSTFASGTLHSKL